MKTCWLKGLPHGIQSKQQVWKYKTPETTNHTSTNNPPISVSSDLQLEDFLDEKLFVYLMDSSESFFHWTA